MTKQYQSRRQTTQRRAAPSSYRFETRQPSYEDPPPRRDPLIPPRRPFQRSRSAWNNYFGLRQRARNNSMAWWGLKIVQGMLLGGGIIALGIVLWALNAVFDGGVCLSRLGLLVILIGIFAALRYAAAPITCRWIVTVPENWFYVVEDGDGYTIEYLESGRMIVPWRWNSRVREYVDFSSVTVNEVVEDVLDSDALPVDIEVSVLMSFNPVEADPDLYAPLRKLQTQEQFQMLIARDVRDIVRKHLNTLTSVQGRGLLHNVQSLETVIAEQLENRASLGLTPASNRPVTVHVRAPQKVKDAYQSLWARAARVREESQTLKDIKALAGDLGVPFDDAFQLFYLMQRGGTPPPSALRQSRRTADSDAIQQPVYIVQQAPERSIEQPPLVSQPPVIETTEHDAITVDAEPLKTQEHEIPPEIPRIIQDPEQAPDPFDVRRRRRESRRRPED
jgi:hypothetical protein